jgi:hypothetical protein
VNGKRFVTDHWSVGSRELLIETTHGGIAALQGLMSA